MTLLATPKRALLPHAFHVTVRNIGQGLSLFTTASRHRHTGQCDDISLILHGVGAHVLLLWAAGRADAHEHTE